MRDLVTFERNGHVATLRLNNPPVNALSARLIAQLEANFAAVLNDGSIHAIVIAGTGNCFSGGADIKEFCTAEPGQPHVGDLLNPLFHTIEQSNKPVVAAIHGTCFGGGLELAMSCHYRVATASTRFAQPEVRLGIIPGAGGTQRLPRLVSIAKATQMCVQGTPVPSQEAANYGLIDVISDDLSTTSRRLAMNSVGKRIPRTCDRPCTAEPYCVGHPTEDTEFARSRAHAAVHAAGGRSFAEGLRIEAQLFNECLFAGHSRAMIHLFLSERLAAKCPNRSTNSRAGISSALIVSTSAGEVAPAFASGGFNVHHDESGSRISTGGKHFDIVVVAHESFSLGRITHMLEIIRGRHTNDRTIAQAITVAKTTGNIAIVTKSRHGSIGQMLTAVYRNAPDDIRVFALINECMQVLEEGAVDRASDLDVFAVHALGFPAHLGGPIWHAEQLGWSEVLARVRAFARPSRLLQALAATGGTLLGADLQSRVAA